MEKFRHLTLFAHQFYSNLIKPLDRKTVLLILILPFIRILILILTAMATPENYVFTPVGANDMFLILLMKSHEWNFQHPYFPEKTVFIDPILTSTFLYVSLGTLSYILHIDYFLFLILFEYFIGILYLLVFAFLIRYFIKSNEFTGILLAIVSPGILILPYFIELSGLPFFHYLRDSSVLLPISPLFATVNRSYIALSQLFGLIGIYFATKRRIIFSGIMTGLSSLFYPQIGFVFLLVSITYLIIDYKEKLEFNYHQFFRNAIFMIFLFILFSFPWITIYLMDPSFIDLYRKFHFTSEGNVTKLFAHYFFLLIFSFSIIFLTIFRARSSTIYKIQIIGIFLILFLFSLFSITGNTSFFMITLFILALSSISILILNNRNINKLEKLVILWFLLSFLFISIDSSYAPWNPSRILFTILFPLIILSYKFLSPKWLKTFILFGIFTIFVTTILYFIYGASLSPGSLDSHYWKKADYNSLQYLKSLPDAQSRVAVQGDLKIVVPYFTGKQSIPPEAFYYPDKPDKFDILFSNNVSYEEKLLSIKENKIKYILITNSLDNYTFLKRIHQDDENIIYIFNETY